MIHLIPLSNEAKRACDWGVMTTAFLAFFKAVPWPEIAGFLAAIYTSLRIIEFLVAWYQGRKSHGD